MKRIVVGMDESEGAANALQWAVEEGRIRDWTVVAVLAWSNIDQHHVVAGASYDPDYNEVRAGAALDAYLVAAVGAETAATIERELVLETAAAGLVAAADGAELLVLGARSLHGLHGLLLSSVSQQCLHHMTSPIAIVRSTNPLPSDSQRIVVAVDGSETSRLALDWALAEARARRCAIDVVHAWVTPYLYGYPYAPPVDPAPYEDAARTMVEAMIAAADTTGLVDPPSPVLIDGQSTSGAILSAADDASLVVVGSRGIGGFKGMLLGSVSRQVTHHASCPVIVIPAATAATE